MIRLIFSEYGLQSGPTLSNRYKTFDVHASEVEAWLSPAAERTTCSFVGIEVLGPPDDPLTDPPTQAGAYLLKVQTACTDACLAIGFAAPVCWDAPQMLAYLAGRVQRAEAKLAEIQTEWMEQEAATAVTPLQNTATDDVVITYAPKEDKPGA